MPHSPFYNVIVDRSGRNLYGSTVREGAIWLEHQLLYCIQYHIEGFDRLESKRKIYIICDFES
jgi:hypothetical protein